MDDKGQASELDERIQLLRNNISDLMEQAAAASGAAMEESLADRLNEQQDLLNDLLKQREAVGQG